MFGFNRFRHKQILLGLLVGACTALLLAAEVSEPPGSASAIVSVLASRPALASSPFITGDTLNPDSPDRDSSGRQGVPGRDLLVIPMACNGAIPTSDAREGWRTDSALVLTGKDQHICQLLDIPPPPVVSS